MGLSEGQKALLSAVMAKVAEKKEDIGSEAITRLLKDHDELKSHFSHMDLTPGSQDLKTHGGKYCQALVNEVNHADSLKEHMAKLQDQHTNTLKLSKEQIKWLLDDIRDLIGETFPSDFNEDTRAACDKYFCEVASVLTSS
ncbi:hemoglobin heart muscle subunit alpha-type-like isoform X1 [Hyla sarda]|uniref:hemoglobin heart muscle subunit alpha-type-like isoform X1 n=1 Tax=Hyla sarda TaxID=327740 RepID=UPI0024C3B5FE|nr:hemoglobin heart muscle subunit alpha-type-like isoform X1 [Hyla sarda]